MIYEEFKMTIKEELQKYYQEEVEVELCEMLKNNGRSYDGIRITMKEDCHKPVPIIGLNNFYEDYAKGKTDMKSCVKEIVEEREKYNCPEGLEEFARKIINWEFVKENVYPILLSTKDNEQILKHLVSTTFLDLSICYIIRNNLEEECGSNTKISTSMLEYYGINKEQLHNQALKNLGKDGYEFLNMMKFIKSLPLPILGQEELPEDVDMYVLTNGCQLYGAAGILNKQLLKNFAQEQDFFILPSSLHECIFVPVSDKSVREEFDSMVSQINADVVDVEERLSNHCYYYDAKENEIKMCE